MTFHAAYGIIQFVAGELHLSEPALMWEHSSAGRASALQAEGHRFEPCCSHHFGLVVQLVRTLACHARGRGFEPHPGRHFASVAQSVEQRTENPRVVGSIPTGGTIYADLAHLVERHLAKVEVASSSLVIRSIGALKSALYFQKNLIRHHSQAVRQRSAKPLFPSSNLGDASMMRSHFRTSNRKPLKNQGFSVF